MFARGSHLRLVGVAFYAGALSGEVDGASCNFLHRSGAVVAVASEGGRDQQPLHNQEQNNASGKSESQAHEVTGMAEAAIHRHSLLVGGPMHVEVHRA